MIYAVFGGYYSDWYVVGYFDSREEAEKYCVKYGEKEEYYVKEVQNLSNKFDLSKVNLFYMHEVLFDFKENKWVMRNEPNRYTYYGNKQLLCNYIVDSRGYNVQPWIKFTINLSENNRKKAEKIAQDYLCELIYNSNLSNNFITAKAIKELNSRLAKGK